MESDSQQVYEMSPDPDGAMQDELTLSSEIGRKSVRRESEESSVHDEVKKKSRTG